MVDTPEASSSFRRRATCNVGAGQRGVMKVDVFSFSPCLFVSLSVFFKHVWPAAILHYASSVIDFSSIKR